MTIQEQRRRRRKKEKSKFKIRVRVRYSTYTTVETDDYGPFKDMYEKYKDSHIFFCADIPPDDSRGSTGCRLDSDEFPFHTEASLKKYGRNKAWIQPGMKVRGKPVILVHNAQLDTAIGATGTIIGGAVALSTAQRLLREKKRRAARARKKKWRTNRRTHRKYRA